MLIIFKMFLSSFNENVHSLHYIKINLNCSSGEGAPRRPRRTPGRRGGPGLPRLRRGPGGPRKGTNGVSTHGVTERFMFFDWRFWSTDLSKSINIYWCCVPFSPICQNYIFVAATPLVLTPSVRSQGPRLPAAGLRLHPGGGARRGRPLQQHRVTRGSPLTYYKSIHIYIYIYIERERDR